MNKLNKVELAKFLVDAKKSTYASGNENLSIKEKDFSTTLVYEKGDYKYHDNYFGGEPYGGREVVFYKGKPIFIMTYYGFVEKNVDNISEVYKFLQNSLALISDEYPYRGPKKYIENDLIYENNFIGELNNFSGTEKIFFKGDKIYEASYMGGFIDL